MDGLLAWLRGARATTVAVARRGALSLRYNWGIGLFSVALAVTLWVFVTDQDNPDVTARVPGSVQIEVVNVPPDQAVVSLSQSSVIVRASASESVFERLTSEDFRATVDLSSATGQQALVDVFVESEEPRAEVVSVAPTQVTVSLENVTSLTVPVRTELVGAPPRGFNAREISIEPQEAVVTGPDSLVRLVAAAEADLNLTGVRTDFEQTLLLQARDAQGSVIQGVEVEPGSATVRVEIEQLEFSAVFLIRPDVVGSPAEGYNVAGVGAEPAFVVLTGPAEILQNVDGVEGILTETVNIEGASDDVVRPVALLIPQGAIATRTDVTVRVTIVAAEGQFGYSVIPRLTNVPAGLAASLPEPTVQVVLSGPLPQLRSISAEDLAATLDLSGLGAGDHEVPVAVQPAQGTTLVSIAPATVTVRLR